MGRGPVSVETIQGSRSLIKGFLKPIFYEEHTGRSGLGPADFEKVRAGYACARCLCEFTTYLPRCPVCGLERDLARDIEEAPPLWNDHLKERAAPPQEPFVPRDFDAFMRDVEKDPDVDHAHIRSLMPRRRR